MNRRVVSFLELKALDDGERTIEGWATRPEADRTGDIVESKGARFKLPLPLLMDHDHRAAVGEVISASVTEAGIRFKAKIARIAEPGAIKDLCDSAWDAARAGLRKAVSIGFRPLDYEPLPSGALRFKSWEWLELSMVSVPALSSATIDQVKAFDAELRRSAGKGRIVRLDTSPHRVVKLSEPARKASPAPSHDHDRPVLNAMLGACDDFDAKWEEAEALVKGGYAQGLSMHTAAAGAKATEAALAEMRERLKRLEKRS